MTNYEPGDVVLVTFPFVGSSQSKSRPALVLVDSGDADILIARITTQLYQTTHDVPINDWQGAGLRAPSVIRLHKFATLEKALVRRLIGSLQPGDRQLVSSRLQQVFSNW